MSLRRLLLFVLFASGLLLAQQAAYVHELGHMGPGRMASASGADVRAGDAAHALCDKCLAYAQLASALTPQARLPDVPAQRVLELASCPTATAGQSVPAACSRDPPRFL